MYLPGSFRFFSFNPRICKRCDYCNIYRLVEKTVSIHASVKDATLGDYIQSYIKDVSIHASVKDATHCSLHKR